MQHIYQGLPLLRYSGTSKEGDGYQSIHIKRRHAIRKKVLRQAYVLKV